MKGNSQTPTTLLCSVSTGAISQLTYNYSNPGTVFFLNDQSLIYKPYRHATIEPYMFS